MTDKSKSMKTILVLVKMSLFLSVMTIVGIFLLFHERSSQFYSERIDHAYVVDNEVEILFTREKITVLEQWIDPHKSQHIFEEGRYYTSGKLKLRNLLANKISLITFFNVGEYTERIYRPFLSKQYPNSIVKRSGIDVYEGCTFYKGECEVILQAMAQPQSMGSNDFDSSYRFSLTKEVVIYVRGEDGELPNKPTLSIPYKLVDHSDKEYKLMILEMETVN